MTELVVSNEMSPDDLDVDTPSQEPSGSLFEISTRLTTSDFRLTAAVSIVFTAIAGFLVFSNANRYIELADQSFYLLMIDEPSAAIRSPSGYHILLSPLWAAVGESVIGFRILRAFLDIGVDVVFGLSFLRYMRSRRGEFFGARPVALTVVFSIVLAGFSAWIYAVNGFGYDQLGAMIFTLLIAVTLWIVGGDATESRLAILAAVGGALFSLALIVRWTAAIAVLFLLVWVLVEHLGFRRAGSLFGSGLVGFIGGLVFVHTLILDIRLVANGIVSGTVDVRRDNYAVGSLFSGYLEWFARGLTSGVGLLIAVVVCLVLLQQRDRFRAALAVALVASGLVIATVHTVFGFVQSDEANLVGTYLATTSVALVLLRLRTHRKRGGTGLAPNLAVPATLTAIPVLAAAGTFLPLFLTALPLAAFWVAALWILLLDQPDGRLRTWAMASAVVMLSLLPWLLHQSFEAPARTTATDSPVLVERGRFEGLLVDDVTQQLLHDLEDLRVQVDPNPTVLSFWTRAAVPFALDGTSIGFPWHNIRTSPNATAATISGACLEDGDVPSGQVVFITEETNPANFGPVQGALLDCGIDFPNDFQLIDTMTAPGAVELFVYVREGEG